MAHKKKGQLTTSSEWDKHLRKYLKKQFWVSERKAGKEFIREELSDSENPPHDETLEDSDRKPNE